MDKKPVSLALSGNHRQRHVEGLCTRCHAARPPIQQAVESTIRRMSVRPASSGILIVDDSPDRALWTAAFKSAGFPTVEAGESVQAIELLRNAPMIAVLVATLLQNGSGAQLVVDAVQLRPDLAVIVIACAGHPVGIQKGRFALLLKPVSVAELLDTAHTLLSLTE